MIGMFVDPTERIKIDFCVAEDKEGKIYASTDRSEILRDAPDALENIEQHHVVFRKPTYEDEVKILGSGVQAELGSIQVNIARVNYQRVVSLIESWTLKDEEGEDVPANKQNIDRLDPVVARVITDALSEFI